MKDFILKNEYLKDKGEHMNMIHTPASGTESYDKTYGTGYKVGHEDWSPYPLSLIHI